MCSVGVVDPGTYGSNTMSDHVVQVWVHGLMATMHAYLGEINQHIALHDVRMQIPL